MPESKTSPRRIIAINKQRQALELRMAGRTWQEIADSLQYRGHSGAIAAVDKALERTLTPPAESYRALTLERLTKILQVFWPMMLQGDYNAARTVIQTIQDIRKLLGLDAPTQVEHGGNGVPIAHEVVNINFGDITGALEILANVGAIRLDSNGSVPVGTVDDVYTPQAD